MPTRILCARCFAGDTRFTTLGRRQMEMSVNQGCNVFRKDAPIVKRLAAGFTLLEILVVVAIGSVLTVIAVPMTISAMRSYRLMAAVSAATGAIQTARYAAIMHGCTYNITFTPTTQSYQVTSAGTCTTPYTGQVIPISGSGDIAVSPAVTYQFAPGGTVTPLNTDFQIALVNPATGLAYTQAGWSNTISVSGVGNVTVRSP